MRGLELLLVERRKRFEREIYLGNAQYSMIKCLQSIAGYQQSGLKSYSELIEAQELRSKPVAEVDIVTLIARHLKGA